MSSIYQQYQSQRIKEVMLYILSKTGDIGYFRLMKTMFCADRQNLVKWGTPITNLDYFAKKHGPVPIAIHDGLCSIYQGNSNDFSDIVTVKSNFMIVHPIREANLDYLSETDIESMDRAIAELKGKNRKKIEDYLHETVYHHVFSTAEKQYSHVDIAMSAGATEQQIEKIRNEDQLLKVLL